MAQSIKNVAVIGAGVSGVSAAAHLKEFGVNVTVFERAPVTGGVWVINQRLAPEPAYPSVVASVAETAYFDGPDVQDYTSKDANGQVNGDEEVEILHAPPGPCYEGLTNNVPTGLMELKLNSWRPGTEQHVKHDVLAQYIQDTALKTGVDKLILHNTQVQSVIKENGNWKIQTSTLELENHKKTTKNWNFDAVVVATGHYHAPNVPELPGLPEWKKSWPLRVQHSKRYRRPQGYANQTVLLIGGSTSSFDIAKEIGPFAKTIYQSTRGGLFDHPTSALPPNAERITQIASFNLGQDYKPSIVDSEAIPGTVTLVDGRVLRDIDRIIICTGYHCTFPFLPQYHYDSIPPEEVNEEAIVTDGKQMHNLHKDIFYIPDPTISFIGVPYYTATFSLFEFQAITIAAVYSGKATLPSTANMRAEYNLRVKEKGFGKVFNALRGKDVEYVTELLAWINQGIIASGEAPIQGHSKEWQAHYQNFADTIRKRLTAPQEDVSRIEVLPGAITVK